MSASCWMCVMFDAHYENMILNFWICYITIFRKAIFLQNVLNFKNSKCFYDNNKSRLRPAFCLLFDFFKFCFEFANVVLMVWMHSWHLKVSQKNYVRSHQSGCISYFMTILGMILQDAFHLMLLMNSSKSYTCLNYSGKTMPVL